MNRLHRRLEKVRAQQFKYAAIGIIAASLSYSCEYRDNGVQSGYTTQAEQKNQVHRKGNDAAFLAEAVSDVLLESQLAEVAVRKASSLEVKELAISVLTDHTIAMDELRDLASRIGVKLPEEMSAQHRKQFARIAKKNGLKFDRAFCEFIYLNNTSTLKKFEKIAQEGKSENLRDWAWGKLGILKRHLNMAGNIESGSNASPDVGSIIE